MTEQYEPLSDAEVDALREAAWSHDEYATRVIARDDLRRLFATLDATRPSGDEALRAAAQAVVDDWEATDEDEEYLSPDFRAKVYALRAALATPSSAPDVEGLDGERLARAYNNAIVATGEGHGLSMNLWREIAREYAATPEAHRHEHLWVTENYAGYVDGQPAYIERQRCVRCREWADPVTDDTPRDPLTALVEKAIYDWTAEGPQTMAEFVADHIRPTLATRPSGDEALDVERLATAIARARNTINRNMSFARDIAAQYAALATLTDREGSASPTPSSTPDVEGP